MGTCEANNPRLKVYAGTKPLVVALTVLAALGIQGCHGEREQAAKVDSVSSPSATQAQIVPPTIPPPKFRVYKFKTDEGVSVVVPVSTTDEQLRGLLWFFRNKVRSQQYKDIGLTHGTAKQWGNVGYLSGMISVYRGEKCANEPFVETTGPCGYGEHDDAYYQWGIDGDQNKDAGNIITKGNDVKVFDYRDGWQVAPEVSAGIEQQSNLEQTAREDFAQRLQHRLTAMGYDITVWAHGEGTEQGRGLVLDSEMFKDTATRVQFINDVLPSWKRDLCKAGFRTVKLRRGSMFELGQDYSLGCGAK
jgi:hypothetical protein